MNDIGTLQLKDNNFQQSTAENSELLIKVSPNRLSYAIINSDKQVVVLHDIVLQMSLTETIDELLAETDYLKYSYKTVKISVETFNFTFIPQEIYNEDNLEIYQSLFSKTKQANTHITSIRKAEIKNVFSVSEALTETLLEVYPNAKIYSQAEPLIDGILFNYQGEKKLILQFNNTSFEMVVLSNNALHFYNIFQINSPDDFNYYLLFTLQQLNLTEVDFEVILAGDIDKENLLYKRVEKYFSKIAFASNVRIGKLQDQFNQVPQHQFFSLFSLYLCE